MSRIHHLSSSVLSSTVAIVALIVAGCAGPPDDSAYGESGTGDAGDDRRPPNGKPFGIIPVNCGSMCNGPSLTYRPGGRVLSNVRIIVVLWGGGVRQNVKDNIQNFFAAIVNSPYMDWLSEYDTTAVALGNDSGTNQHIGPGTVEGPIIITPSRKNAVLHDDDILDGKGNVIQQGDIMSELDEQITHGQLPDPGDGQNALYIVYFPPLTSIVMGGSHTSCTDFCGYHSWFSHTKQDLSVLKVAYGVLPDHDGVCCSCPGLSPFQTLTESSSHELVEAITDPFPGKAWTNPNDVVGGVCSEIGDLCAHQDDEIIIDGISWEVQKEWSQKLASCIVTKQKYQTCLFRCCGDTNFYAPRPYVSPNDCLTEATALCNAAGGIKDVMFGGTPIPHTACGTPCRALCCGDVWSPTTMTTSEKACRAQATSMCNGHGVVIEINWGSKFLQPAPKAACPGVCQAYCCYGTTRPPSTKTHGAGECMNMGGAACKSKDGGAILVTFNGTPVKFSNGKYCPGSCAARCCDMTTVIVTPPKQPMEPNPQQCKVDSDVACAKHGGVTRATFKNAKNKMVSLPVKVQACFDCTLTCCDITAKTNKYASESLCAGDAANICTKGALSLTFNGQPDPSFMAQCGQKCEVQCCGNTSFLTVNNALAPGDCVTEGTRVCGDSDLMGVKFNGNDQCAPNGAMASCVTQNACDTCTARCCKKDPNDPGGYGYVVRQPANSPTECVTKAQTMMCKSYNGPLRARWNGIYQNDVIPTCNEAKAAKVRCCGSNTFHGPYYFVDEQEAEDNGFNVCSHIIDQSHASAWRWQNCNNDSCNFWNGQCP